MIKLDVVFTIVVVLSLVGCVSMSPPVEFYTLSGMTDKTNEHTKVKPCANIAIGVGPVSWPYFLDRPQIVTRSGENKLVISEFNRWGGSLAEDFSRVLVQNLSLLLGSDRIINYPKQAGINLQYRIEIDAQQFDGQLNGKAVLKATWRVRNNEDNAVLIVRNTTVSKAARDSDYSAFVAAQSKIVSDLSRVIATQLENLCAKRDVEQINS